MPKIQHDRGLTVSICYKRPKGAPNEVIGLPLRGAAEAMVETMKIILEENGPGPLGWRKERVEEFIEKALPFTLNVLNRYLRFKYFPRLIIESLEQPNLDEIRQTIDRLKEEAGMVRWSK